MENNGRYMFFLLLTLSVELVLLYFFKGLMIQVFAILGIIIFPTFIVSLAEEIRNKKIRDNKK